SNDAGSESDGEPEAADEVTRELAIPAQRLKVRVIYPDLRGNRLMEAKLDEELGGLAVQGATAPFHFTTPPHRPESMTPPTAPATADDTRVYVLLVDGVDEAYADLSLDWSRHLPPNLEITRR